MRSPLTVFLVFLTTIWASAVFAASGPLMDVGQDVTRVMQPIKKHVGNPDMATTLQTGSMVFSSSGQQIGSIRAMTRKGEQIKTVWIGRTAFPANAILMTDGQFQLDERATPIDALYASAA